MAIIKDFITPQGVTAQYHRIVKAEFNVNDMMLEIALAIYVSKEARDAKSSPLWHEYIRVPFDALATDPREALYLIANNFGSSYVKAGASDLTEPVSNSAIVLTEAACEVPVPVDTLAGVVFGPAI